VSIVPDCSELRALRDRTAAVGPDVRGGLARVRLRPLLAAFFLGRLVSYSIYVSAASAAHDSLSHLFDKGLFSPEALATQFIGFAVLIAVVLIDWPAVIDNARGWWATRRGQPAPPSIRQSALPPVTPGLPKT
jgi:hypothetical protein